MDFGMHMQGKCVCVCVCVCVCACVDAARVHRGLGTLELVWGTGYGVWCRVGEWC